MFVEAILVYGVQFPEGYWMPWQGLGLERWWAYERNGLPRGRFGRSSEAIRSDLEQFLSKNPVPVKEVKVGLPGNVSVLYSAFHESIARTGNPDFSPIDISSLVPSRDAVAELEKFCLEICDRLSGRAGFCLGYRILNGEQAKAAR